MPTRWIDETNETEADRLDTIRVLGMTARAAAYELDAMDRRVLEEGDPEGPDHRGEIVGDADSALNRVIAAEQALSMEIGAAEDDGLLEQLSRTLHAEAAGRP